MARISRVAASGYLHHVTQRGVRSFSSSNPIAIGKTYLDFMGDELNRYGIEVLAWCLMTNHTHLMVVPNDVTYCLAR